MLIQVNRENALISRIQQVFDDVQHCWFLPLWKFPFGALKMLHCLIVGDKGDACVSCEGTGPPGLPGPAGVKGDRGR